MLYTEQQELSQISLQDFLIEVLQSSNQHDSCKSNLQLKERFETKTISLNEKSTLELKFCCANQCQQLVTRYCKFNDLHIYNMVFNSQLVYCDHHYAALRIAIDKVKIERKISYHPLDEHIWEDVKYVSIIRNLNNQISRFSFPILQ